MNDLKIPHYVQRGLTRLGNRLLISTASHSEEAEAKGGGFLYSTHPDGRKFPAATARVIIDHDLVEPLRDGLLDGCSQTYRLRQSL